MQSNIKFIIFFVFYDYLTQKMVHLLIYSFLFNFHDRDSCASKLHMFIMEVFYTLHSF